MYDNFLTPEQSGWVESLVCERLTADDANDDLRMRFCNDTVERLETYITSSDSWKDDESGRNAVYVVKRSGEILVYFSLRCGLAFEDVLTPEQKRIHDLSQKANPTAEEKQELEDFKLDNSLSDVEFRRLVETFAQRLRDVAPKKNDDHAVDDTRAVHIVNKTFGAIEMVHFCRNIDIDDTHTGLFPNNRLGELVFWFKIVPLLKDINSMAGCEYVYLFAAESERNDRLTAHYTERLKFKRSAEVGVNKPLYATGCKFMIQPLAALDANFTSFLNKINTPIIDESI